MEETSSGSEAHGTLSTVEEIHCHKARIFSLLSKAPVLRAWTHAVCDGAVYLGKSSLPESYADRYFQVFKNQDIRFVTFSIVTAFKETILEDDGQVTERTQCHISPAQREASEFLIVTFSNNYEIVAVLPRHVYWPDEANQGTDNVEALSNVLSGSTISGYSYSIRLLLAHIEDIKRITVHPMHPTTTPFQLSLDGRIPRADYPRAIGPQPLLQDRMELLKESALRTIHSHFSMMDLPMKIDFLHYQPLLRDFRIIIPSGETFPDGLEAVINHTWGRLDIAGSEDDRYHLRYADYFLTHGITQDPDITYFVPRRLIAEDWFDGPNRGIDMPTELLNNIDIKDFVFEMDEAATWVENIWMIICKYPPGDHLTRAEEKQEVWKEAFPWPELEAQVTPQKASTPQKSQVVQKEVYSKHDSGTGFTGPVKPNVVDLIAAHYLEAASLGDKEAGKDSE